MSVSGFFLLWLKAQLAGVCSALPRFPEYMNKLLPFKRNKHAIIWRVEIKGRNKPIQTAIHTPFACDQVHTRGKTHCLPLISQPAIKRKQPAICPFAVICVPTRVPDFIGLILPKSFTEVGHRRTAGAIWVQSRAVLEESPSLADQVEPDYWNLNSAHAVDINYNNLSSSKSVAEKVLFTSRLW